MLLSTVAERVYWIGRYVERAEATARLVKVHTELFLDLPRAAGLQWRPLLEVTGSGSSFDRYRADRPPGLAAGEAAGGAAGDAVESEEEVVHFLLAERASPVSVLMSIDSARTNMRANRPVLPRMAWEVLNRLSHWSLASADAAVHRRTRLGWCAHVIEELQLLSGILGSTMNHDEAYAFFEMGRQLERADMTTRVLDVQAATLLDRAGPDRASPDGASLDQGSSDHDASLDNPYDDVTWMGVLCSVSADHTYRQKFGGGVAAVTALRFLLRDAQFPRSVEHCLTQVARALLELPRYEEPMAATARLQAELTDIDVDRLATDSAALHEAVDQLQQGISAVHVRLAATYFRVAPRPTVALAAQP